MMVVLDCINVIPLFLLKLLRLWATGSGYCSFLVFLIRVRFKSCVAFTMLYLTEEYVSALLSSLILELFLKIAAWF